MVVAGTRGYAEGIQRFAEATTAISFTELHGYCLPFLPTGPGCILDVGAGIGRDAAAFAAMGHHVVAVEPCVELLQAARTAYTARSITWVDDVLPNLGSVAGFGNSFDFILCSAVWHHIDEGERAQALTVLAGVLKPGGYLALTLRNGPAGIGSHVFATDAETTIQRAAKCKLNNVLYWPDEASLIPGKEQVRWSKLVFKRI